MQQNQQPASADQKQIEDVARKLFSSDDGRLFLAYMKSLHLDRSALGQSPELTYYRLGQKELVQVLISFCDTQDTLPDVAVIQPLSEFD
jgi:hypothetical protein